jgi:hypothetical protein
VIGVEPKRADDATRSFDAKTLRMISSGGNVDFKQADKLFVKATKPPKPQPRAPWQPN